MTINDRNKFIAAVICVGDPLVGRGYINRHTFEVAPYASRKANYDAGGEDLWIDTDADRRKVDACPADWIAIPKYDDAAREKYGDESNENFMRLAEDFFAEAGLPIRFE